METTTTAIIAAIVEINRLENVGFKFVGHR